MIRVVCLPEAGLLEVSGHAGSAPRGQDLVCAGASMLVFTACREAERLESLGRLRVLCLELRPGWARLQCHSPRGTEGAAEALLQTVLTGFRLLRQGCGAFLVLQDTPEAIDEGGCRKVSAAKEEKDGA